MNVKAARQVDEARVVVGELCLEHLVGNIRGAQFEPGERERREQRQDDGELFQRLLRPGGGALKPLRLALEDIPFSSLPCKKPGQPQETHYQCPIMPQEADIYDPPAEN
jgi:hypothetical protein